MKHGVQMKRAEEEVLWTHLSGEEQGCRALLLLLLIIIISSSSRSNVGAKFKVLQVILLNVRKTLGDGYTLAGRQQPYFCDLTACPAQWHSN
jgi:hypothetical protein